MALVFFLVGSYFALRGNLEAFASALSAAPPLSQRGVGCWSCSSVAPCSFASFFQMTQVTTQDPHVLLTLAVAVWASEAKPLAVLAHLAYEPRQGSA